MTWTLIQSTVDPSTAPGGLTTLLQQFHLDTTSGKITPPLHLPALPPLPPPPPPPPSPTSLPPFLRYPRYHYVNDTQYRDLVKAYGILFVIQVNGRVSQHSPTLTSTHTHTNTNAQAHYKHTHKQAHYEHTHAHAHYLYSSCRDIDSPSLQSPSNWAQ